MYTPLDIENKKFAKQMMNGYSVEEVDEFLDELTADYEKLYKQANEANSKIEELQNSMEKYKNLDVTLNSTLIMAQSTADEIKKTAQQQADQIVSDAQGTAREKARELDQQIMMKTKELDDLQKQFDVYKAKMDSLLISQLELLKETNSNGFNEHSGMAKEL